MNNQDIPKMYSMFDVISNDQGVWYIENVVSYPDELISHIQELDLEDISHKRISKWSEWTANNNDSFLYGLTKTIYTNQYDIGIENFNVEKKSLYIKNSLRMAVELSMDKYFEGNQLDKSLYKFNDENYYIKKWNADSSMGPHTDGQYNEDNLALSIVIYLNDSYEGGEINFPEKNITIKPKLGSAVIFSSNILHQVLKIKNGERYISPKHMYKI